MRPSTRRGGRPTGLALGLAIVMATTPLALAADAVPFNYTLAMTRALRGRDMTSPNGNFCNTFHATHVDNINMDPQIWIELRKPPLDTLVGQRVSYRTDGGWYKFCWIGFLPGETYFFKYTKNDNGKEVDGAGTVSKS